MCRRDLLSLFKRFQPARRARNKWHSGSLHGLPGAGFRAHRFHRCRCGSDEFHARASAGTSKFRIFGEKSVAGMNGIGSGTFGDIKDLLNVEIRLARCGWANGIRFVGLTDMQGGAVDIGVNRNCGDSHLVACTDHAYCDFSPIRDENFLEHPAPGAAVKPNIVVA